MARADARKRRAKTERVSWIARYPRAAALGVLVLLLAATAEERTFGTISDEQQMLATSVAISETGELGIARGQLFMVHRPKGDALSPYGMGQPLAELPASFVAGGFEKRFGPGSSQTLYVALEIALVALAAWGAGLAALALGAGDGGFLVALFGTGLASPLWAYTAAGYSEPFQAAALALAFACAVRAVRAEGERAARTAALLAGALAAAAVLGKSLNVAVAPLVLAPLALDGARDRRARWRLVAWSAAGAAPVLAAWLAFELVRFGRPFAAYGGTAFTHPMLDGVWRLLVGPNKGLLLYFPLLALAVVGVARLARAKDTRGSALATGGPFVVLLALSSAWWAWDGTVGWGPRLLVPAIPLLAAAAGSAIGLRVTRPAVVLGALGLLANALGVFQSEAAAGAYLSKLPPAPLSAREASAYPSYFLQHDDKGGALLPRQHAAAADAALSPFRVHLFLLRSRLFARSAREVETSLASPPWRASRPELVPARGAVTSAAASLAAYERVPFSWPHLFAAMAKPRDERADTFATAWDAAVADQVLRALDLHQADRALALSEHLFELTPSGYTAALYGEALRVLGRRETLKQLFASLPAPFRSSPSLGVVDALAARDVGDEQAARAELLAVSKVFPRPGILRALAMPIGAWPEGLHEMTGENLEDRPLAAPAFGRAKG